MRSLSLDGLERDGGDRAPLGVVGVAETLAVVHEEVVDDRGQIGEVGGLGDGETGALAGADQGLGADLLLAPREVVVDRPERRIGLGHNLFDPRGRIPLTTEQADGRVQDAVAGVAGVGSGGHDEKSSTESM